ncbi:MAG: glycosyltransferase [Pirellulales bacterium]
MRVALIHDWLVSLRGGEKCLDVLCREFPDARLFTLLHRRGSTTPAIERMRISTSFLQRVPGIARWYRHFLPMMPAAARSLALPDELDLAVSFSHAVAKGVPVPPGVPHVCYCFTPMRYAWQMRGQYFPSGEEGSPARWLTRPFHAGVNVARNALLDRVREWDRRTSANVTNFIAISQTVRQRIRECYGRASEVIYPPVDVDFYTPADVRREDFYLCVSALVPYKRIELAIEACNRAGRRLVVIGAGPQSQRLAALAGPTVQLMGWQSDEQIRDHLRRARALIFPGCEDFGIVPLEAQGCGCPVIAYGQGGATETVIDALRSGDGTGVLFDRQQPEAVCDAIDRFERNPDRISPELARRQAERFSTERFRRELMNYLQAVVAERSGRSISPALRPILGPDSAPLRRAG